MANSTFKNLLLASLPQRDQGLFANLQRVPLTLKKIVYEEGSALNFIYFIEEGVASILMNLANGDTIEIGMVGREGMIGVSALLGAKNSAQQVVVQAGGTALRLRAESCKAIFDKSAAFRKIALRFLDSFFNLTAQTAACNSLHVIEQRCARWLLMATERIQSDSIPMTHEFLSSMIGVRRAGVTETAGELQRLGLIRYSRGQFTITDRKGLEAISCECYGIDHHQYRRLRS